MFSLSPLFRPPSALRRTAAHRLSVNGLTHRGVHSTAPLLAVQFSLNALPSVLQKEFDSAENARNLTHLQRGPDFVVSVLPSWAHVVSWRCALCDGRWAARPADRCDPQISDFFSCPTCRASTSTSTNTSTNTRSTKTATTAALSSSMSAPRLAEAFPLIAAQWDGTRNAVLHNRVLFESVRDVPLPCAAVAWWSCPQCRRAWEESVDSRVRRQEKAQRKNPLCPACESASEESTDAGKSRAFLSDDDCLLAEAMLQPRDDPKTISLRSERRLQWRCRYCAHEFGATVADRFVRYRRCPQCSGEVRTPLNLLTIQRPDVCREMARTVSRYKVLKMTIHDDTVVPFVCRKCVSPFRMPVRLRCLLPPGATACPKCRFCQTEWAKEINAAGPAGPGVAKRLSLKAQRSKRQSRSAMTLARHELNRHDQELMN